MKRRFVLAAAPLILLALTGAARKPVLRKAPPPPVPAAPLGDLVRVTMVTELGPIELELDHAHAPLTVENFVRYVDARRFDGMTFYRAMRLAWGDQPNGLIQAGLQGDPRKLFKPVAHEPTDAPSHAAPEPPAASAPSPEPVQTSQPTPDDPSATPEQ